MERQQIVQWMGMLQSPDNVAACGAAQALVEESERSGAVEPYMDVFLAMLDGKSSLVRNRAAALIAANARWDTEGRIDAALDSILTHFTDPKPVTARQFVQASPWIAAAKPALADRISDALAAADFSQYADSMRPLLEADRRAALERICAEAREGAREGCAPADAR